MALVCLSVFARARSIVLVGFIFTALLVVVPGWAQKINTSNNVNTPGGLDLFLLIGQSNQAGRAEIESQDTSAIEHVWLLNNQGVWEAATNPLNRYSSIRKDITMQKFGPGYPFAKNLHEAIPDIQIGLVVNARGGSSIKEWQAGEKYYEEALRRAKIAQESGSLKAIIWHQGSSDRRGAEKYMPKLKSMVESFRRDLGNDALFFVAGQLGYWKDSVEEFNTVIASIAAHIPHATYVSGADLTPIEDGIHFDSASQRLLGRRYTQCILENIYVASTPINY